MTAATMTPAQARAKAEALALKRSGLERPAQDHTKYAAALRAVLRAPEGQRLYEISVGRTPPDDAPSRAVPRADQKARATQRPGEAYADALSRVLNKEPELYAESCVPVRGPALEVPWSPS